MSPALPPSPPPALTILVIVVNFRNLANMGKSKSLDTEDPPGEGGCLDFIRTEFDNKVDAASLLPGKYTFEKYIGGNFLGEIARYDDIC